MPRGVTHIPLFFVLVFQPRLFWGKKKSVPIREILLATRVGSGLAAFLPQTPILRLFCRLVPMMGPFQSPPRGPWSPVRRIRTFRMVLKPVLPRFFGRACVPFIYKLKPQVLFESLPVRFNDLTPPRIGAAPRWV